MVFGSLLEVITVAKSIENTVRRLVRLCLLAFAFWKVRRQTSYAFDVTSDWKVVDMVFVL